MDYDNAANEVICNNNLNKNNHLSEQFKQQKNQINSEISLNDLYQLNDLDSKNIKNVGKPCVEKANKKIDDQNNPLILNFQNKKFTETMPEYYHQNNSINDHLNDRNLNKISKNNDFNQNKLQKKLPAYSQLSIPNSLIYQDQHLRRNQTPPTSTSNPLKQSNTVNFYNQYHPSQFHNPYDPSALMHISRQQFQHFQQSNPSLHASNLLKSNDPNSSNPIKYDNNWTIGLPSERKSTSSNFLAQNKNTLSSQIDQNKRGTSSHQQHNNLTTNSFNLYSLINPQNQRITQPYQQNLLNHAVLNTRVLPSIQSNVFSNQKQNQLNYHQTKSKSLDAESFLNSQSKFLFLNLIIYYFL